MNRNMLVLSLALAWGGAATAPANNVMIANVARLPLLGAELVIELDLSWENSWRDEFNHDAVWLFMKYSLDQGQTWRHATLKGSGLNPPGFAVGSQAGLEIIVPPDRVGAFVQRAVAGKGHVATEGLRLVWDLKADGIESDAKGRVSVHAIEMVHIPAGPFYLGDDTALQRFRVTYVNSPDPALATTTSGNGTLANPYVNLTAGMGRPQGVTGVFDPNYPNGYSAFYLMKYDLSRAQYLTFLNMLTATQAATLRTQQLNFLGTSGTITGTHPNLVNAQPWRTAAFFGDLAPPSCSGWQEFTAYADWAGLRPMTEMEFEKAARGPDLPVDRDYPWGTASRFVVGTLKNTNTDAEAPASRHANILAQSGYGYPIVFPTRPGAMADAQTDQIQANASYYGVMDLAGNVGKQVVASGNTGAGALIEIARNYSGRHGDGTLAVGGTADVPGWPVVTATSYGGGAVGVRGGDNHRPALSATVADRFRATTTWYPPPRGIRAARTAP